MEESLYVYQYADTHETSDFRCTKTKMSSYNKYPSLLNKTEQSSALPVWDASNMKSAKMSGKENKQAQEHESRW